MSWRPLRIIAAIISVSSMLLGSPTATAQAEDNLIDLGAVAPGLGINNSGEVVLQNYWYSQGTLTAFPNGFTGNAINASGHIAGNYGVYYYGTLTALPTPSTPDLLPNYTAPAINDSGAVLIYYAYTETANISDLYSDGTLTNISISLSCGFNVTAQALNDSDDITGSCWDGDVFIYNATTKATTDLGIQGVGNAINASGEVTGTTSSAAAFLYSDGKVTLLPATVHEDTACHGSAINASGFIVGTCSEFVGYGPCPPNINCGVGNPQYYPEYIYHPFVYNGTTRDLNELVRASDPLKPYVTLTDARGINDSGLVIVNGTDSRDNSGHAYLMQLQLLKVLLYTSASKVTAGTPVTLTWTTSPSPSTGVSCIATGGSDADGWTGEIALNGKKAVTESAAGTYSYGVSCTVGSQKQQADTSVVVKSAVVASKSGGGAFDSLSLMFLFGVFALRRSVPVFVRSQVIRASASVHHMPVVSST